MNPPPQPPDEEETYEMPALEAVLAGTLALMTGHAQHGNEHQRCLMAAKIARQLKHLGQHPALSVHCRTVMSRLYTPWRQAAQGLDMAPEPDTSAQATPAAVPPSGHWHAAARRLQ
jgi:hypothetical protein